MQSNGFSLSFMKVLIAANNARMERRLGNEISVELFLDVLLQSPEFHDFNIIKIMKKLGVNISTLVYKLVLMSKDKECDTVPDNKNVVLDQDFQNLVMEMHQIAYRFNSSVIEPEYLIIAVLRNHKLQAILKDAGLCEDMLLKMMVINEPETEIFNEEDIAEEVMKEVPQCPAIETHAKNLRKSVEKDDIPTIGREKEIAEVIAILARRFKNNPILIGPAGVGKTALVEELQRRINKGDVPEYLQGCTIYDLNVTGLLAGSQLRGAFEEKLRNIIAEASANPKVILFIDEIHTIIGAGTAGGADMSNDMSNSLKPALARGDMKCIGATTPEEYARYMEKDHALARRLHIVKVEEPDTGAMQHILANVVTSYEKYHGVRFEKSVVPKLIDLSRYIIGRNNPDKVIDIIDTTLATAKAAGKKKVNLDNVRATVAQIARIPEAYINTGNFEKYISEFRNFAASRVIGQPDAIEIMKRRLMYCRFNTSVDRPKAVMLIDGPGGSGKTSLAMAFGEYLLGDKKKIRVINANKTTLAQLEGPPPGYVGADKHNNTLADYIRQMNLGVVIVEDIDKGDQLVVNYLISALENGMMIDALGQTLNFSNTFFILTSSTSENVKQMGFVGDGTTEDKARSVVARTLNKRLIARIDDIIITKKLDRDSLVAVAKNRIRKTFDEMNVELQDADEMASWLVDTCKVQDLHAVNKAMHEKVVTPVIEKMCATGGGRLKAGIAIERMELEIHEYTN